MDNTSNYTDSQSKQLIKTALDTQRSAFLEEGRVSAETRIDRLERMHALIIDNQVAIQDAAHADFGSHSRHQARMSEVMAVAEGMTLAKKQLKHWMKPEKRKVAFPMNLMGAKARVEYQPKGVIGVLGTWNFPVYTSIMPLAGALAAGNRAMVKLSEVTPASAELLKTAIAQYFDPTEVVGITGGADVGADFAASPFDHLIFTGGTNIGRHILAAAAPNLTPVTLELGGKSPVVIGRSYDINKAAQRIFMGKTLNMGQACLAPDYAFVPSEKKDAFVQEIVSFMTEMFPTILNNPDYTSVINARHFERINHYIEDAKAQGAEVIQINPANEDMSTQANGVHKIPMTLVINPSDDMACMQEEIFGPLLNIKTYDHIDECLTYINAHNRPLGLYYFGEDASEENKILGQTISGGVALNDVMAHSSCDDLPFGGIGHSGMGNYHGLDGFKTFSHPRAIFKQSKFDLMKLAGLLPPYGDKADKQLDKLCK